MRDRREIEERIGQVRKWFEEIIAAMESYVREGDPGAALDLIDELRECLQEMTDLYDMLIFGRVMR